MIHNFKTFSYWFTVNAESIDQITLLSTLVIEISIEMKMPTYIIYVPRLKHEYKSIANKKKAAEMRELLQNPIQFYRNNEAPLLRISYSNYRLYMFQYFPLWNEQTFFIFFNKN